MTEAAHNEPSGSLHCYTPGPWKVYEEPDRGVFVETDQERENECSAIVCQCGHLPMREMAEPERHRADAALIAAAPELLEACRLAADCIGDESILLPIRDAIRRATGV